VVALAAGIQRDPELLRSEAQVLAQERRIRALAAGASVRTQEHTTVGTDGKRYVTSISITISGPEKIVDRIDGGAKGVSVETTSEPDEENRNGQMPLRPLSTADRNATYSPKVRQAIEKLKAIERDVISHEAAHKAAGGQYAGPVSYSYTTGPDGKRYITGGEVPISAPAGRTPEETARIMDQVQRAALAAGDPSPQDISVAAKAASAKARAQREISRTEAGRAYSAWNMAKGADRASPFSMPSLVA